MFSRCKDSARRAKPKAKNTFFDLGFRAAAYLREAKQCKASEAQSKKHFFLICTSEPQPIFAKQSSARRAKSKAKNTFFDLDFRAAAYLREAKRARRVKSKAKNTFPNFVNAPPSQMT